MMKQMVGVALVCAVLCVGSVASAQTPRIDPNVARAAIQSRVVIAPDARAALASRLTGQTITPAAITDTVSVSVLAPVVGDPRAPTLSLEIRRGTWITTGDDPRAVITTLDTSLDLKFARAANTRYLVVCDGTRELGLRSLFGQRAAALTWESATRAAILVPQSPEAGVYTLSFTGAGAQLRSCEVSRIG